MPYSKHRTSQAWTAPIQVIVCLVILCCEMGPSALAGFSLFLLLTPLQERAMSLQLKMRRGSMKFTDQRANLLQEYVLLGTHITRRGKSNQISPESLAR